MHISAELKAIAFLSAILVPALGAVTAGQITTELQDVNNALHNIITDASNLFASTLVDDVNSITTNLGDFNSEIPGSLILSEDEQNEVVVQIDSNALLLTASFEVTIARVTESMSVEDKTAVDDSVVDLYNEFDDTVVALGRLGSTISGIVVGVEADIAEAIEGL